MNRQELAAITVTPGSVAGTVRVPGSKSVTHRAYVLAARSDAPVTVAQPLRAADPDATLACLHALGARIHLDEAAVRFEPADWQPPHAALDCRNAGTALRLLTAQVATQAFPVVLTGDDSLRKRPNAPLLDALGALGAHTDSDDGRCPVRVQGPIRSGEVTLPPRASSQFASALLLAMPLLEGSSTVTLEAPVASAPYLEVTRRVLADFGITVHVAGAAGPTADAGPTATGRATPAEGTALENGTIVDPSKPRATGTTRPTSLAGAGRDIVFEVTGGSTPRASVVHVPADWSTAAFPMAAAAVTGGKVHVQGPRSDDPQGDRAITTILSSFGADVRIGTDGVTVAGSPLESPGAVDVEATPDLFPALCAVAARASGTTTFTGGAALRHKESDRIAAMAQGLQAMGVQVQERPDGLVVHGLGPSRRPRAATLASHGDHRIHMALAVLGLAADGPTTIDDPGCVAVSYPSFHADLAALQEGA